MANDPLPIRDAPDGTVAAQCLKRADGPFQPDVVRFDLDGGDAVIWKTYAARPWHERHTVGRWFTRREAAIMQKLAGLPGCPGYRGRPHPYTLAMDACPGEKPPRRPDVAAAVARAVRGFHARGITHGDIHRRNLLWDEETGRIWVFDYTQSLHHPRLRIPLIRRVTEYVYTQALHIDRIRLTELKRRWAGRDAMDADEEAIIDEPPWYLRLGRTLRKGPIKRVRQALGWKE